MKMDKLRFQFAVLAGSDGKSNVVCITSIETTDGRIFNIPDDLKPASKHTSLISSDVFTKIKNSLKKRHQTRAVWIPLNTDLRNIYLDEGENLQFGDQYLEEITRETVPLLSNNKNTTTENKNISKVAERFMIEKFSNKNSNVNQWITVFESECERFEILEDKEKIEILKHLLEKQCIDWYTSMLIKLTVNSNWIEWKENLCETYGNKGWTQERYAFNFKYQAGSLLEYATKKERLL
ncbi:uncharacterized protein LOC123691873 [Colias croceus]|uniref:uncharacterized protein LOC123691873 n=1 Tax=Colias crocea TaxID=72248 RepID=UPI001E27D648|nr:uncharacterized protein LOC123691873 [Colias croceus]